MIERMKFRAYHRHYANQYFWRTYDGSEIDLIEEREGKLFGYEFKWGKKKKRRIPQLWKDYPDTSYQLITREDLKGFIL